MTNTNIDCLTCGACCTSEIDFNIKVHFTDEEGENIPYNLKGDANGFVWQKNHMAFEEVEGVCRCKALKGKIGGKVRCSIYKFRPGACQKYEVGNQDCMKERLNFGITV